LAEVKFGGKDFTINREGKIVKPEGELFPVRMEDRYGYINRSFEWVIEPKFDYASSFSGGLAKVKFGGKDFTINREGKIVKPDGELFPVKRGKKYGYINRSFEWLIDPKFDNAFSFSEGLAKVEFGSKWFFINEKGEIVEPKGRLFPVKIGDKYGYIDRGFNFVLESQFDEAYDFSEGLARVKVGNKWGFIKEEGGVVIPLQFDEVYDFSEGLAMIKIGGKYGYIDNKGKIVIPPQFEYASSFSEGLAVVKIGNKYGYINDKGNFVIPPKFDDACSFFHGQARVKIYGKEFHIDKESRIVGVKSNLFPVKIGDKYGYIDRGFNFVLEPQFDEAYDFSEGLARVKVGNKWGFIKEEGGVVIPPQFDEVYDFSEGLAVVKIGNKYRYIDKEGGFVFNIEFEWAQSFSGGQARVKFGDKYFEINKEGKIITQGREDLFPVKIGDKYGYIDISFNIRIEPQFDEACDFREDLAAVKIKDKWGYINKEGEIKIKPRFAGCLSFSEGLAAVSEFDKKWGYINKDGKYEIQPKFDMAMDFSGDRAEVKIGLTRYYINRNGEIIKEIIDIEHEEI